MKTFFEEHNIYFKVSVDITYNSLIFIFGNEKDFVENPSFFYTLLDFWDKNLADVTNYYQSFTDYVNDCVKFALNTDANKEIKVTKTINKPQAIKTFDLNALFKKAYYEPALTIDARPDSYIDCADMVKTTFGFYDLEVDAILYGGEFNHYAFTIWDCNTAYIEDMYTGRYNPLIPADDGDHNHDGIITNDLGSDNNKILFPNQDNNKLINSYIYTIYMNELKAFYSDTKNIKKFNILYNKETN